MDRKFWAHGQPAAVVWLIVLITGFGLGGCTTLFPPSEPTQPSVTNVGGTSEPSATEVVERPVESATPQPSLTSTASIPLPTASPSEPPPTRTPTATPTPEYAYQLQEGSPVYLPNLFRTADGCNWSGVAGQVFDEQGQPVNGLVVEVDGNLNDQPYLQLGISGGATQYGQGGYEITLGQQPFSSQDALTIVLFDLAGKQLSSRYPLTTSDSCTQNLIIMNFLSSMYFETRYYLPVMSNGAP
jgi:hypothetical protein